MHKGSLTAGTLSTEFIFDYIRNGSSATTHVLAKTGQDVESEPNALLKSISTIKQDRLEKEIWWGSSNLA